MKSQPTVLVVDDNSDLLNTFSLILKRRGYDVDTAREGFSAVEKHKRYHFDVILMDVVMPGMNGVETFRRIREIDPSARVVLMTAYHDESELKSVLNEGVFRAVYKPVDIGQLMSLISDATSTSAILVVDDDEDFCRVMAQAIRAKGYRVSYATSGERAMNMAESIRFQMAFVDIKMHGMDGLETCLKMKEVCPGMVQIIMTGYRDEAQPTIEKARAASIVTCLYKPFDLAEVLEMLNKKC
ncbi:MAG: response regulator [Chloroflexi bacterium]|nr:response regulator [Chloroflexota bacterium]